MFGFGERAYQLPPFIPKLVALFGCRESRTVLPSAKENEHVIFPLLHAKGMIPLKIETLGREIAQYVSQRRFPPPTKGLTM